MVTRSGHVVSLIDPQPESIDLFDIAHGLAHLCRFNGHTRRFYSVAEHSMHVARVAGFAARSRTLGEVEQDGALDERAITQQALLHDAAEAYLGDLIAPVKHFTRLGEAYEVLEDRLEAVIFAKFACPHPLDALVKGADKRVLAAELEQLMGVPPPAELGRPAGIRLAFHARDQQLDWRGLFLRSAVRCGLAKWSDWIGPGSSPARLRQVA